MTGGAGRPPRRGANWTQIGGGIAFIVAAMGGVVGNQLTSSGITTVLVFAALLISGLLFTFSITGSGGSEGEPHSRRGWFVFEFGKGASAQVKDNNLNIGGEANHAQAGRASTTSNNFINESWVGDLIDEMKDATNDVAGSLSRTKRSGRRPRGSSGLRHATLVNRDLSGQDLSGVDLSHATLTHCNLSRANLQGAILRHAILTNCNLDYADLTDADFGHAILNNISHQRAITARTNFAHSIGGPF